MDPSPEFWSTTSSTSWWSRVKGALAGILVGLVIFVAGFPLLIWNEGRAVWRARALGQGAESVVSVEPGRIDPAHEGALVHLSGLARGEERLEDPELGVGVEALRLRREVEVYQWRERAEKEERDRPGGGTETVTTYEYERVWSDRAIDSDAFEIQEGHRNPAVLPIPSRDWAADPVRVGRYRLAPSQVDKITDWETVGVPADRPLPDVIVGAGRAADGGYYLGDPMEPSIGDMRVSFAAVYPSEITVVARQLGDGLVPYEDDSGTIELVAQGTYGAREMFERALSANRTLTWILRAVGSLLLFLGLTMIFKPLSVVADLVPFVGRVIEAGTGLIAFLIAGLLALVTIALAWIAYRPLVGAGLLVAAITVLWLARRRLREPPLPGRPAAG